MEKTEKRKLTIWGIAIFAGLVAAIVMDQMNPNKNHREVPESDMLSQKTNKIKPSKMQNNVANWLLAKKLEKPYVG